MSDDIYEGIDTSIKEKPYWDKGRPTLYSVPVEADAATIERAAKCMLSHRAKPLIMQDSHGSIAYVTCPACMMTYVLATCPVRS